MYLQLMSDSDYDGQDMKTKKGRKNKKGVVFVEV